MASLPGDEKRILLPCWMFSFVGDTVFDPFGYRQYDSGNDKDASEFHWF